MMPEGFFQLGLSFDDVLLVPRKSDVCTRKDVDISSELKKQKYTMPIISSPMDTVTEGKMVRAISSHGGLGIIHRYNSIEEQTSMVRELSDLDSKYLAAAIGVSGDFEDRATALYDAGVRTLCVDIAHGHHTMMERALKTLKDIFAESIALIAGNVATPEAFIDLDSWGADAIRVGVGGGSICSTRLQTGHGVPTFQSVYACSFVKQDSGAKIIADGGIKNAGDIVKSFAAGADFVMLGSLLSGTDETPGQILKDKNGNSTKVYRGMASTEAQEAWRGHSRSLEGVSTTVSHKGPVGDIFNSLSQNIRSGFSYSGSRSLDEFKENSTIIKQTTASMRESDTHILNRK